MRRVTDSTLIGSVLLHKEVFPYIGDDHTPDDWRPVVSPAVVYLMPDCNRACFSFMPRTAVLWDAHVAVLPEAREHSVEFGAAASQWMFDNTPCRCIVALSYRPQTARLAERIGFKRIGTLPKSKLRGGVLLDQEIFALGAS